MKEKILVLVIGILIGAILASCGFLIFEKSKTAEKANINVETPEMSNFTQTDRQKGFRQKEKLNIDKENQSIQLPEGQMPDENFQKEQISPDEKQNVKNNNKDKQNNKSIEDANI